MSTGETGTPHQVKDEEETDPPLPTRTAEEDDGRLFRICEVAFCLVLFTASLVVEYVAMPQTKRPIPVQVIGGETTTSSTTFVRNLLYDEELGEESVGDEVLIVVGLVLPLLAQLAMATWCTTRYRHAFDRYNTFCSYFMAFSMTFLIVNVMKLYCGSLRPHFYEVCQPDESYQFCTSEDEQNLIREIRDSFPSGHAGLALSGLGSFSLYFNRRFGVGSLRVSSNNSRDKANSRDHQIARVWSLLSVLPVLLALSMGVSRIYDNYHHPVDIVGGAAIGGVAAYFCHHVWFLD